MPTDSSKTFAKINFIGYNAGIIALSTIAETDDATFDRQLAVNLRGTFNNLREAAKRVRNGGRIINLSSRVVGLLQPTYGVYVATKAAVDAMTGIFAKELHGRNITVNAIVPGPTATDLFFQGNHRKSLTVSPNLHRLSAWANGR